MRCLIRKDEQYTKQEQFMVTETPELYERVVKPYIAGFPAARTKWSVPILVILASLKNI